MEATTVKEVLIAARAELARRGLHKGNLWPSDTDRLPPDDAPCCGYGAVGIVTASPEPNDLARDLDDLARRHLDDVVGAYYPTFNDLPETTLDDVLAVFDKAIVTAS